MYKLNAVAMVVLSLAVIGTGTYLGMEKARAKPGDEVANLIRLLADSDPDVRRDAEAALKRMGPHALPALKSATVSGDQLLAGRAKQVINQIERAPVIVKQETPEKPPPEEPAPGVVELTLNAPQGKFAPGEVRLYARLRNGTPQPVLLARHRMDPGLFYGVFASFEITSDEGTITVPVDAFPRGTDPELDVETIGVGLLVDLYRGQHLGAALSAHLQKPGTYRVRLVYDAQEKSAYRDAIALRHPAEGVMLPPARLASNTIVVTIE